ncbi:hypothetical protein FB480_10396 [Agrobacterium vitis]|nr:hypothetical protein FB480_10396 [Agrobacterium vitis]
MQQIKNVTVSFVRHIWRTKDTVMHVVFYCAQ